MQSKIHDKDAITILFILEMTSAAILTCTKRKSTLSYLDKLSGCRETAYEGKTNDVGAKKQKEQKEQRGTTEKTRGTKMQKEKQKK